MVYNNSIMMKIKLNNFNAFETTLVLMKQSEVLTLCFCNEKDSPCVAIGSSKTMAYSLNLSRASFMGLWEYIRTGEYDTFEISKGEVGTLSIIGGKIADCHIAILKFVIKKGVKLHYLRNPNNPREVMATLSLLRGFVYFKFQLSEELAKFLYDNKQVIYF